MKDSHEGDILMQDVNTFPLDVSVYGVEAPLAPGLVS